MKHIQTRTCRRRLTAYVRKTVRDPGRGLNDNLTTDETLIIELPRLKWWAKVQVRHMCCLSSTYVELVSSTVDTRNVGACRYSWMFVGCSITSYRKKTISELQTAIKPSAFRWLVRRCNHLNFQDSNGELRCEFHRCVINAAATEKYSYIARDTTMTLPRVHRA